MQLLCAWQSDTGFGASPAFWYYIVCSGATQRGLLQVWRLWMFQLSEFPDKPVGGTQWGAPFIRVQFNFTLSYITLSPRGRISHPILHLGRASYAPKQLNSFFFFSSLLSLLTCRSSPKTLKINTNQVCSFFYLWGSCLGKKREIVVWIAWLEQSLDRMYKVELASRLELTSAEQHADTQAMLLWIKN